MSNFKLELLKFLRQGRILGSGCDFKYSFSIAAYFFLTRNQFTAIRKLDSSKFRLQ